MAKYIGIFICFMFHQAGFSMKQQQHFDQASSKYKDENKRMMNNKNLTSQVKPQNYTKENINKVDAKTYYDNDLSMDSAKQKNFQGSKAALGVKKSNDTNRHEIDPENPAYKTALGHQNNADKILSKQGDRYACTEIAGKGSQKTHTETCQASNVQPMQCIRYPEVKIIDVPYQVQTKHAGQLAASTARTGMIIPPETGTITSARVQLDNYANPNLYLCKQTYQGFIAGVGMSKTWPNCGHGAGGLAPFTVNNINIPVVSGKGVLFQLKGGQPWGVARHRGWNITMNVTRYKKEAKVTIKDTCQNINKNACTKIKEQCVEGAVTRNVGGVNVHQPCWKYDLAYTCGYKKHDNCGDIAKRCNFVSQKCIEEAHGYCFAHERTYKCSETQEGKKELICGNPNTIQFQQAIEQGDPNEFLKAVSALAGASEAGESIKKAQSEINMLKGESSDCGEGAMGVYDCCDGGGNFLHGCSEGEKALQKARQKKIASFAGRYCGKKVLGICVAHRQTWCVFDSKLARILQEQGRVKQLGITFGSGEHPNCTGMTPDQLQKLDFRKIDFSEFFEDVKTKATLPDSGLSNSLSNKYQRDKANPEINTKLNQSRNQ